MATRGSWIRKCPASVLVAAPAPNTGYGRVTSALDPFHPKDVEHRVDHMVAAMAFAIAGENRASVDLVTVIEPTEIWPLADSVLVPSTRRISETDRAERHEAIRNIVAAEDIADEQIHVLEGAPAALIERFCETGETDLLVIGGVARSRLKSMLIGSEAEKLIKTASFDCLLVKVRAADVTKDDVEEPLRSHDPKDFAGDQQHSNASEI